MTTKSLMAKLGVATFAGAVAFLIGEYGIKEKNPPIARLIQVGAGGIYCFGIRALIKNEAKNNHPLRNQQSQNNPPNNQQNRRIFEEINTTRGYDRRGRPYRRENRRRYQ